MDTIDNSEPEVQETEQNQTKTHFGLGASVGAEGPWPEEIPMPVEGVKEEDWPVATFWFERAWDLDLSAELEKEGLSGMPVSDSSTEDMIRQNVYVLSRTLSREKAWENLHRFDGTIYEYVAPSHAESLTDKDPRVILAKAGIFIATQLKVKAWGLANVIVEGEAKNSETSSASGTKTSEPTKQKPTRKRRGSKSS